MSSEGPGGWRPLVDEEKFCLEGCRSYTQYYNMRKGFEKGVCAFCGPDPELNDIVWQDAYMMVWHVNSKFMRPELRLHILIVPKRHIRFMADLVDDEAVSLIAANRFARDKFGYTGGLNHAREGDMRNNAGTVPHLHWNLFEPNGKAIVRVPVFKDPKDRIENKARAARFASFYEQSVPPKRFERLVSAGTVTSDGFQTSQL